MFNGRRLRREHRKQVYAEAVAFYGSESHGELSPIKVHRHIKTKFAGIFGVIAIQIAAQLAWYFIKKWLDKKTAPQDVPDDYQDDEDDFEPSESEGDDGEG